MTLPTDVVAWMFFAIVLLAALAIVTNYFIVSRVLTGRAVVFERRPHEHSRILHPEHEQWRSER